MLNSIHISHVFVADQDKALDFYVNKLGLEVSLDQDLGFMRWLTVRVPGQPGRDILLEKPGPPAMDDPPPDKYENLSRREHRVLRSGLRRTTAGKLTRNCLVRCRIHPGTSRAAVRHRHGGSRSVWESHPYRAAENRVISRSHGQVIMSTQKVTVATTVAAPIEEVWRAYTTPEDIKRWNAASDDWHTTRATVDLRTGGVFHSLWKRRMAVSVSISREFIRRFFRFN